MSDPATAPNSPTIDLSPNRVPKAPSAWNLFGGIWGAQRYGREDEERQLKASDLINTRQSILAKIPSLTGKDKDDAVQSLAQVNADIGQLYHPIKAPGALMQDWHFLMEKMHGIKPPVTTQAPRITATEVPGVAATTMPGMASPLVTLPATGTTPEMTLPAATPAPITTPALPAYKQISVAPAPPPAPTWGQAQLLKKQAAAMQKAQEEAKTLEAGAGLSPEQQAAVDARGAMAKFQSGEAVNQAKIDATLATAKKLGFSDDEMTELKRQMLNLKPAAFKPLAGAAGQPQLGPDGKTYVQYGSDDNGNVVARPISVGFKPNTKPIAGGIVRSKQSPTGFAKTFVDPYTSKVVGWTPITPSSYYQGVTNTRTSTDPFGVTTTSTGVTQPLNQSDVDLSGYEQLPSDPDEDAPSTNSAGQQPTAPMGATLPNGTSTSTAPASVSKPSVNPATSTVPKVSVKPSDLKKQIPSPPQADSQFKINAEGHIPDEDIKKYGFNPNLAQIANNILDGQDITKVSLKDRGAAEQLAMKYGWRGQGLFTPREALQLKEGASFLSAMANSPSLKVLDKGFFANIPITVASPDPVKEGFFGRLVTNFASRNQTPDQQKFMDLYRQLDAMAVGLRALVQSGRGTQKQVDLLISELPNPYNTPSSEDARRRLNLVQRELDIAAKTGKLPEAEKIQDDFGLTSGNTGTNPSGGMTADDFRKKYLGN